MIPSRKTSRRIRRAPRRLALVSLLVSVSSALLLSLTACRMDASDDSPPAAADNASQVTIGEVSWYVDYEAALEVAKRDDKALWVHFGENPG